MGLRSPFSHKCHALLDRPCPTLLPAVSFEAGAVPGSHYSQEPMSPGPPRWLWGGLWARESLREAAGYGDREGSPQDSQAVLSPPHLLGLWGQRLLQEGLPQEVQVIQTTAHWQGRPRWGLTVHAGGRSGDWGFCAIR